MIEVVDDDYVFFFARVVTFSYMESSVAIGSAFSYPRDLREANGSIPFYSVSSVLLLVVAVFSLFVVHLDIGTYCFHRLVGLCCFEMLTNPHSLHPKDV